MCADHGKQLVKTYSASSLRFLLPCVELDQYIFLFENLDLCLKGKETCANGVCLTMSPEEHCDGKIDCKDGLDEIGCNGMHVSKTIELKE